MLSIHETTLAWLLLDLLVKSTLLLVATLLIVRLLAHHSAAWRHLAWLMCFAGLCTLPAAMWLVPTYPVSLPAAWGTANNAAAEVDSLTAIATGTMRMPGPLANADSSAAEQPWQPGQPGAPLEAASRSVTAKGARPASSTSDTVLLQAIASGQPSWLVRAVYSASAVWAAGFVMTLLPFFLGVWKITRLWRNAQVVNEPSLLTEVRELARQLGVARSIQVREVQQALVPITWGILYPKILLPAPAWSSWSDERRRAILLHELSHVKRLDVLWQVFSRVVCSFYWFHPLVWFGYRRLRCERELACDDRVIESGIKASDYAQHLVCVAREFQPPTACLTVAMAQSWGLEQRIRAIVQPQRSRSPLPRAALRLTVSACLLLTVLLAIPKLTADGAPQESQPTATQENSTNAVEIKDDENKDVEIKADELLGVVVDEDGKPLADVLIDAWSWHPGNETRSDAQGRFRLKFDDARSKIELRVVKDGYSPLYQPLQPLGVRNFKIVLGQKTYIEGVVRDSSGAPVPNIEVRGEQGPQQADGVMIGAVMTATQTDDKGRYRLFVHPDTYQLSVRTESGQVARLNDIAVLRDEAKQQDIELQRGVRLQVLVINSVTQQPAADFVLWHFMHPDVIGRSDADGKMIIDGMLPGTFEFMVGEGESQKLGPFSGYLPRSLSRWWSPQAKQSWEQEDIKPGEFQRNLDGLSFELATDMPLVTVFVEPGVTFRGQVLDPDDKPVEGATVAPARTGSGNSLTGDTRYSVKTDAEGRYEVIMPAGKAFEYNLIAHDGEYQQWRNWANGVTEPIRTQPGDKLNDMNIQLTRPATARGRIVAEGDRDLGGREVRTHAVDRRENRYYDPTTRTNADGTFELKFIRPGERYVQVEPFWLDAAAAPEGTTAFVELAPGEVVENIELKVADSSQPVMPAVTQREFTIQLLDENETPLPEYELILSGYGRQANLNALVGDPSKLAERWNSELIGGEVLTTDASGKLSVQGSELFSEYAAAVAVVAMDATAKRAAIGSLYPDARQAELTLTMQPLQTVVVTIDDAEIRSKGSASQQTGYFGLMLDSALLIQREVKELELEFQVPPGTYQLFAMYPLGEPLSQMLEVKPDSSTSEPMRVVMKLQPNGLTKMIGREPPPLKDIVAWQGGEPTSLEGLRGKVVLLDFWGYWCGPCLAAMPEMVKLHDELHEQGLEILAIHDGSLQSLDELNKQLEATRKNLWNDRDLPFRVALAGSPEGAPTPQGTVIADYGIREFPTTLLIGRDGKVVGRIYPQQVDENLKLIRELLEQ